MINVLIIEDDRAIVQMLSDFLESKNINVNKAYDTTQAQVLLQNALPDLIILDWMLPNVSGINFLRALRRKDRFKTLPVIILTAKVQEDDKITGLDNGADDYMTKPVALKELYSRIKALIRRSKAYTEENAIIKGAIKLSPKDHRLMINGENVSIGITEFRLLHYFMRSSERLHSRTMLLDQVWGPSVYLDERTVDVHISRLRKVLKKFKLHKMVQTVHGIGYRFTEN